MVSPEKQEIRQFKEKPTRDADGIRRDDLQEQTEGYEGKLEICLMKERQNWTTFKY